MGCAHVEGLIPRSGAKYFSLASDFAGSGVKLVEQARRLVRQASVPERQVSVPERQVCLREGQVYLRERQVCLRERQVYLHQRQVYLQARQTCQPADPRCLPSVSVHRRRPLRDVAKSPALLHAGIVVAAPQLYPTPRRLTRAEYDRMIELGFFHGERLELIHGSLLRMAPIGPPHSTAVSRLNKLLVLQLLDRAEVRIQQPLVAFDDSEPEPDVAVVPPGDYSTRHPERAELVVEVAESSLEHDRETKAPLYAASNVREYWIVDLAGRAVEIHEAPESGRYARVRRARPGETVAPSSFPDVRIDVSALLP